MKYTDLEKHAIASLIIRIISEENSINTDNKMHLLDILHFIGMTETELMSLRGAYETQKSVSTILQMSKEKRLDLLVIILRLAGRLGSEKFKHEYTPEKMSAFFLIIKQGCFNDIDIDPTLDAVLTVINYTYWVTIEKK